MTNAAEAMRGAMAQPKKAPNTTRYGVGGGRFIY